MQSKYRSDLSKAKNLGASGTGTHHWYHQRITALVMSLMTIWLFFFIHQISIANIPEIIICLKNPINVVMLLIFSVSMMYHSYLGMQVIIEDYVHCRAARLFLLISTQIFSIITVVSFIVTLIYVMIL